MTAYETRLAAAMRQLETAYIEVANVKNSMTIDEFTAIVQRVAPERKWKIQDHTEHPSPHYIARGSHDRTIAYYGGLWHGAGKRGIVVRDYATAEQAWAAAN